MERKKVTIEDIRKLAKALENQPLPRDDRPNITSIDELVRYDELCLKNLNKILHGKESTRYNLPASKIGGGENQHQDADNLL
ncbi:hypothetical protein [Dysgonomonas termitidis]|uniref:Uncharacterized protein n=1 Tax=Dysgonomonas termitidis TaxID=1516126 RepID=A0ABV9KU97_9BACT